MDMFSPHSLKVLLFSILMIFGCSEKSSPTITEDPPQQIEKSAKRGLAYNLTDSADLDTLKSGVSWWYNWYFETSAPNDYYADYQMEFLPMLWGGNKSDDYSQVKNFIMTHTEIQYLLVLNLSKKQHLLNSKHLKLFLSHTVVLMPQVGHILIN